MRRQHQILRKPFTTTPIPAEHSSLPTSERNEEHEKGLKNFEQGFRVIPEQ